MHEVDLFNRVLLLKTRTKRDCLHVTICACFSTTYFFVIPCVQCIQVKIISIFAPTLSPSIPGFLWVPRISASPPQHLALSPPVTLTQFICKLGSQLSTKPISSPLAFCLLTETLVLPFDIRKRVLLAVKCLAVIYMCYRYSYCYCVRIAPCGYCLFQS